MISPLLAPGSLSVHLAARWRWNFGSMSSHHVFPTPFAICLGNLYDNGRIGCNWSIPRYGLSIFWQLITMFCLGVLTLEAWPNRRRVYHVLYLKDWAGHQKLSMICVPFSSVRPNVSTPNNFVPSRNGGKNAYNKTYTTIWNWEFRD